MPVPAGRPVRAFQTVWNSTPAVSHQSSTPRAGARSSTAATVGSARTMARNRSSSAARTSDEAEDAGRGGEQRREEQDDGQRDLRAGAPRPLITRAPDAPRTAEEETTQHEQDQAEVHGLERALGGWDVGDPRVDGDR